MLRKPRQCVCVRVCVQARGWYQVFSTTFISGVGLLVCVCVLWATLCMWRLEDNVWKVGLSLCCGFWEVNSCGQDSSGSPYQVPCLLFHLIFWDLSFSLNPVLPNSSSLASQQAPGPSLDTLNPVLWDCRHAWLLCGCRRWNLGTQAYEASTLQTEPAPQPRAEAFWGKWLYLWFRCLKSSFINTKRKKKKP